MKTFLKGMIVGLGAIAPGLSGSILLVIFGLYQRIVEAVSTIFKSFKKNVLFLLPLGCGIVLGILLFSKLIVIPLEHFPMQTHYTFLGLILGTIPMLWREVTKEGFLPRHYLFAVFSFLFGIGFFVLNRGAFPNITDPSLFQSVLLGLAVSAAYLIPGVDSFAILSSFGLYELWLNSINTLDLSVLIPAAFGLAIGGISISLLFNLLFKKAYITTYSVIFGLFISVILNFIVKECPVPSLSLDSIVSIILLIVGFIFSLIFSNLEKIAKKIKKGNDHESI